VTPEVIVYTRTGCGLCEEAVGELRRLQRELAFTIREIDIDAEDALREEYNDSVPVIAIGDRVISHAPIHPWELRELVERSLLAQ
jgi:glutaredoxin